MKLPLIAACLVAGSTWSFALADQDQASNPKTARRPYTPQPTNSARTGKAAPGAPDKSRYEARMLARKLAGQSQGHPQGLPGALALGGSDSCAAPDVIAGNGIFAFDNSLATTGSQGQAESACSFYGVTGIARDVWFDWTAPSTGIATFSLCGGTAMDSKIAVYPGSSCPAPGTALACNDDNCGTYALQSSASFLCTGGNSYLLQLGNFPLLSPPGSGTFTMSVAGGSGPANDDCWNPAAISGSGTFVFDNSLATTGTQGQSESPCYAFGTTAIAHDVWFVWTAPSSGTATFSTCSGTSVETKIAAYAGSACPLAGTALACNDDSCNSLQSSISFTATSGSNYLLQLGTWVFSPGGPGTFTLNVAGGGGGGPANDDCWSAAPISGTGVFAFDNSTATTGLEGQAESLCTFFGGTGITRDIWFAWTAPGAGTATFSLCGGTSMDSKIAVYAGPGCPTPGNAIGCNDDFCSAQATQSQLGFPCTGGSTYLLQLGNAPYSPSGSTGTFTIQVGGSTPNDSCSAPLAISGLGTFGFDNSLATTGTEGQSESLCNFYSTTSIQRDLWFAWTAPGTGSATFSLCGGSSMDSKIAAYAGSSCPSPGTALACNDDFYLCAPSSSISFPVSGGSTYMLQLGTYPGSPGSSGTFSMNIGPGGPPANDDCSAATAISGVGSFNFDTTNATTGLQQGLLCGQGQACQDVWFDWTAPLTGVAQWSLCGSAPFDTLVAVYAGSSCPGAGSALACDDDGCAHVTPYSTTSLCVFDVTAGSHYLLQLGGFSTGQTYTGPGTFDLEIAPHPGPCSAWDDGTCENLIGWLAGGDMVWMSRFGEPGVPTTISAVEVSWGSAAFPGLNPGNGTPTDVFIWQDGGLQDGNPNDAQLLLAIPATVSLVDTDSYVTFPIAPLSITGYFFVGSHQDHLGSSGGQGQFVAPFDETLHIFPDVSWFFGNDSGFGTSPVDYGNPNNNVQPPFTFDSRGYGGQAMVRVVCGSAPATYLCDPGSSGTLACPCSNPPSGSGRGCNNSSATGGASISGAGSNSLASPTLVFTTAGEKPSATSILLQGTSASPAGIVLGQGVRCASGVLKRLFVKTASGGSIIAPNFAGGDADIPARSALLGDPIHAGQSRWYLVYYRDPIALGGCPAIATYNATNTAEVLWQP